MKRRDFLKLFTTAVIGGSIPPEVLAGNLFLATKALNRENLDHHIKDYLFKMKHFDKPHKNDFYLDPKTYSILKSSFNRLKRLQKTVGHGNYYLLNFDEALKIARSYSAVGRFTKEELDFLEMIFYEDSAHYGFLGEKPLKNLTDQIKRQKVVKVRQTGNYLYKGGPFETYKKIKQAIGDQVILTSGVRSLMKQFILFLGKAYRNNGNISLASRSLAPPGYSYHGIGDFDVGQIGFGALNFTSKFTSTEVFNKLINLGYLKIRYQEGNLLGVRFEPWHIQVQPGA
jgi:D-alanyl-D-alanine carboxypeptidase